MVDAEYGNVHKGFLQMIMNYGSVNKAQAIEMFKDCLEKENPEEAENYSNDDLRNLIDEINEKLNKLEQKITIVRMEIENEPEDFVVFCQTNESPVLKALTNEAEANYMKSLIEAIVQENDSSITMITAINLSSPFATSQATSKKISKTRAQELIDDWKTVGYFISDDDVISLGPRTIGEFGETLRNKFPDYVWGCHLCKQISTKPLICPKSDCETAMDKWCAKKHLQKHKKCPKCRTAWEFNE